jgi:excisionase family DNA binding protein
MNMDKSLWRYEDTAKFLNVSEGTLRYWVHTRSIRFLKLGRLVRFSPEQIKEDLQIGKIGEMELPDLSKESK